ncbi:MAG: response regulator [Candidatus Lindowbacteria bacterium]|nr:response regulator [Candidatus Lindowbacteria bacterium]
MKPLLIDDDPESQLIVCAALAEEPEFVVITADEGTSGIAIAKSEKPDLIVTDFVMPDMNGVAVLRCLRNDPDTADIPVIFLTGSDKHEDRNRMFENGAMGTISKPFDPTCLVHEIKTILPTTNEQYFGGGDGLTSTNTCETRHFEKINERPSSGKTNCLGEEHVLRYRINLQIRIENLESAIDGLHQSLPFAVKTVPSLAHTLKGSSGMYGFGEISKAAGIVEGCDAKSIAECAQKLVELLKQQVLPEDDRYNVSVLVAPPDNPQTRKILYAEDDDLTSSVVKHRLVREGFSVSHFSNGTDALHAATTSKSDLILLDIQMPGMDGFSVLCRIRENPDNIDVPIIMLTSLGKEHDVVRGLELGANDYRTKPFSPTELIARIHRTLRSEE